MKIEVPEGEEDSPKGAHQAFQNKNWSEAEARLARSNGDEDPSLFPVQEGGGQSEKSS